MPRWVFLLGVGMLLVAVAFIVTEAALGPRPGLTEANVQRLKPGMTLPEVEAILGVPANQALCCYGPDSGRRLIPTELPPVPWFALWKAKDRAVVVHFDERDHLEQAAFGWSGDNQLSPLDRIRAYLGW